nr:hypothetical protein [Tanacetum cinerariifolium]
MKYSEHKKAKDLKAAEIKPEDLKAEDLKPAEIQAKNLKAEEIKLKEMKCAKMVKFGGFAKPAEMGADWTKIEDHKKFHQSFKSAQDRVIGLGEADLETS